MINGDTALAATVYTLTPETSEPPHRTRGFCFLAQAWSSSNRVAWAVCLNLDFHVCKMGIMAALPSEGRYWEKHTNVCMKRSALPFWEKEGLIT